MKDNYVESSRKNWVPLGDAPTGDQVKIGCLQRIATAVELSCKDRERLERDYRYMRDRRDELQRQLDSALRSNAALRGVINRMKKATSKKAQP